MYELIKKKFRRKNEQNKNRGKLKESWYKSDDPTLSLKNGQYKILSKSYGFLCDMETLQYG